jgi:hypothetical protein
VTNPFEGLEDSSYGKFAPRALLSEGVFFFDESSRPQPSWDVAVALSKASRGASTAVGTRDKGGSADSLVQLGTQLLENLQQ